MVSIYLVLVQTRNPLLLVIFTFVLSTKIPYIAYRQRRPHHFNKKLMNEVIRVNYSSSSEAFQLLTLQ